MKESMNTLLVCLGLLSTHLLVPIESSPGKLQILYRASYTSVELRRAVVSREAMHEEAACVATVTSIA